MAPKQDAQSRRRFLAKTLALGCSAAASPFVTPVTWAAAPGDARLVVIILRGGMDGLDVVQPYGDKSFRSLRKTLKFGQAAEASDLDGYFSLSKSLSPLAPLWSKGELAFGHAVSTPYRDKRSHFDGQDMLENGSGSADGRMTQAGDGWLNRALSLLPGSKAEHALAVGRGQLRLLSGREPSSSWSPDADLSLSSQAQLLLEEAYADDPLFHEAIAQAFDMSERITEKMSGKKAGKAGALAKFAADRLNEQARIAGFSLGGFDTHKNQRFGLNRALGDLSTAILTLKSTLGGNWQNTTVVAVTEFGRTARENGSGGTDHGTGGAMLLAGGTLRKAQVVTEWPGLASSNLYRDRDLMPTRDVRAMLGWILRDSFGFGASDIERVVFPNVDMGSNPRFLA